VKADRLKPKSKKQDAAHVKDISFVGRDAVGIQELENRLTDVVFPPVVRERDEDIMAQYERGQYGGVEHLEGPLAAAEQRN
jgi:hypothetical protein